MRILKSVAILASVLAVFAAGCGGRDVLNVNAPVVTAKPNPPPSEVVKAIVRAGANTNWRITEAGPGQLIGFRMQGPHSATVNISYTPEAYSITLKETTMQSESGVHRTYNRWVQQLDQQIRSQLGAI